MPAAPVRRARPLLACAAALLWLLPPPAAALGLSQEEQSIVDAVTLDADYTLVLTTALASINSGSRNTEGVTAVADRVAAELRGMDFEIERIPGGTIETADCPNSQRSPLHTAPHLVARRYGSGGKRLLLSAHLDTVFEPASGFTAVRIEGDRLSGPGVADCKGGIAVILTALRALHWAGALEDRTVTIVLTSDEELGSLTSRSLLEAEAATHDAALVFEPSRFENGVSTITTERKGLGQFRVVVEGRAAHAGADHEYGINALEQLARHIQTIHRQTDYAKGTTLNVGVVTCPGCKRNIVPGCARAEVDVRFSDPAEGRRIEEFFKGLAADEATVHAASDNAPARTTVEGVLHRPVWQATPESTDLRDLVFRVADALGLRLVARKSGGGSDANLIAAADCPAVDGLGPVGGRYHTREEWVSVRSLTDRSALAALTIARLLAIEQPAATVAPSPPVLPPTGDAP